MEAETRAAGFNQQGLCAVQGPGEIDPDLGERLLDPAKREQLLALIRSVEGEKTLLGLSTHFAVVAEKQRTAHRRLVLQTVQSVAASGPGAESDGAPAGWAPGPAPASRPGPRGRRRFAWKGLGVRPPVILWSSPSMNSKSRRGSR